MATGKQQAEDEASSWTLTYHHSICVVIIRIICCFVIWLCSNILCIRKFNYTNIRILWCEGVCVCLYVCINGVVCILRFDFSHCVNRTYSNFVCASTPHIVTLYPLHTPDFDIICAHFAAVCGPVQIFTQLHYYKRISSYMHFTYVHMYVHWCSSRWRFFGLSFFFVVDCRFSFLLCIIIIIFYL